MQQHRIISLASILAMLLIPVLGWFLVAQPQLAAATEADQQRIDMESQIAASEATVAQLKADSAKLPELNADLNDLRTSIPAGVDSSGYIDGLDALAKLAKVKLTGLTVEEAQAYTSPLPPVAPVAPDATEGESAEGETDAAAETPVVEAEPVPGIVTNPLIDSSNFVYVPVSVSVEGTSAQILKFVQGLQSSPRLFLVNKLETSKEANTSSSTLTSRVSGYIYAIPTGVEGKPRPISTTVKSMEPAVDADAEDDTTGAETDGESTEGEGTGETPNPNPTNTPAP